MNTVQHKSGDTLAQFEKSSWYPDWLEYRAAFGNQPFQLSYLDDVAEQLTRGLLIAAGLSRVQIAEFMIAQRAIYRCIGDFLLWESGWLEALGVHEDRAADGLAYPRFEVDAA